MVKKRYGATCLARGGNVHKSFVLPSENCSAVRGSISRARRALDTVPPTDTTTYVKQALFKCVIPEAYFRTLSISLADATVESSTQENKDEFVLLRLSPVKMYESSKQKRKSKEGAFWNFYILG